MTDLKSLREKFSQPDPNSDPKLVEEPEDVPDQFPELTFRQKKIIEEAALKRAESDLKEKEVALMEREGELRHKEVFVTAMEMRMESHLDRMKIRHKTNSKAHEAGPTFRGFLFWIMKAIVIVGFFYVVAYLLSLKG